MSIVVNQEGGRQLLKSLTPGRVRSSAWKRTFSQNNIQPGPGDDISAYVEADFDGYGPKIGLTWGVPFNGVGGFASVQAENVEIVATGDTKSNSCYGYYLIKPAVAGPPAVPELLVAAERFPDAQEVAHIGDGVVFTINWTEQPKGEVDTPFQ
jgi:hypothetical protein